MAVKKSVRVNTARGGRPKGNGVRHTSGMIPEKHEGLEIRTVDEDVKKNEEIEFDIRETIRTALVDNQNKLSKALSDVAETDPKSFLSSYKDYAEFILPKLQRTDSKIDSQNPVILSFESIDDYKLRQEEKQANKPKNIADEFPE